MFVSWPHIQWPAVWVSLYPWKGHTESLKCGSGLCVFLTWSPSPSDLQTPALLPLNCRFCRETTATITSELRGVGSCDLISVARCGHPRCTGVCTTGVSASKCALPQPTQNHKTLRWSHLNKLTATPHEQVAQCVCASCLCGISLIAMATRNSLHHDSENFWKLHVQSYIHPLKNELTVSKGSSRSSKLISLRCDTYSALRLKISDTSQPIQLSPGGPAKGSELWSHGTSMATREQEQGRVRARVLLPASSSCNLILLWLL